ncbi:alpha/beta hydrolase fold domain-containing protein [Streptomyces sp. SID8354]|nr:alpha/beta hydrolase fold domain-containing protein [Streptomyces sp. SID8354]
MWARWGRSPIRTRTSRRPCAVRRTAGRVSRRPLGRAQQTLRRPAAGRPHADRRGLPPEVRRHPRAHRTSGLSGLAPAYLLVCDLDALRDPGLAYARRLARLRPGRPRDPTRESPESRAQGPGFL